jgi:GNAT superfamily N-acetyltransferase
MDKITVAAWRKSYRGAIPDEVVDAQQTGPRGDFFRSQLPSEPPFHTAVATVGSAVVGYVHVGPNRDGDEAPPFEIWGLYVAPEHHRNGIGRTLLRHAIGWIVSAGGSEATLWTLRDVGSTRRFYEAMGGVWDRAEKSETVGGAPLAHVRYLFEFSEES